MQLQTNMTVYVSGCVVTGQQYLSIVYVLYNGPGLLHELLYLETPAGRGMHAAFQYAYIT